MESCFDFLLFHLFPFSIFSKRVWSQVLLLLHFLAQFEAQCGQLYNLFIFKYSITSCLHKAGPMTLFAFISSFAGIGLGDKSADVLARTILKYKPEVRQRWRNCKYVFVETIF